MTTAYRGRFAPSPSGPLHFGSMLTALASWLDARSHGGEWLLRMEDLDRTRVSQTHADDILRTLEQHGLYWDGPVLYQGNRGPAYAEAAESLAQRNLLFACTCTRRELSDSLPGIDGPVYPGTCRDQPPLRPQKHALRVKVDEQFISFADPVQGMQGHALARDVGDFIIRRSDGLYAYQLAVVVDDADQGITHVVRGADLLNSTPRQIYLQQLLGYTTPEYAHMPLLTNAAGAKLSKREPTDPLGQRFPWQVLAGCLALLGQPLPPDASNSDVDSLLQWARQHWELSRVPRETKLAAPAMA